MSRDSQLTEIQRNAESVQKENYQQEQIQDRLRHYEAQAQLVETLQRELSASQVKSLIFIQDDFFLKTRGSNDLQLLLMLHIILEGCTMKICKVATYISIFILRLYDRHKHSFHPFPHSYEHFLHS